jgi:hypothetical protein
MLIVRLHIADSQRDGTPDSLVWRDWLGDRLVLDNGFTFSLIRARQIQDATGNAAHQRVTGENRISGIYAREPLLVDPQ